MFDFISDEKTCLTYIAASSKSNNALMVSFEKLELGNWKSSMGVSESDLY